MMTDAFNSLEGVTCNFTEGAMYSFPRLHLPPKASPCPHSLRCPPCCFHSENGWEGCRAGHLARD